MRRCGKGLPENCEGNKGREAVCDLTASQAQQSAIAAVRAAARGQYDAQEADIST